MVSSIGETISPLLRLSNDLADAAEKAGAAVVAVHARNHVATSGVHWRTGVIVTADHGIDNEDGITVTLSSGDTAPASIVGRDAGTDIAILKVDAASVDVAEISDDALKVGHLVLALARPGGSGIAASFGAISAVGGAWRTWSGGQIDKFVRPDLTMYPGFSGGGLVDAHGHIIGINTSGLTRNMALTIPVTTVNRVVDQILTRGRVTRGYLGLGLQRVKLPDALAQTMDLSDSSGLIVVSVESGGPGDSAGVLVGDIVVTLDGRQAKSTEDVQAHLDPERVGKSITIRLIRGGVPKEISLMVGERPARGA